MIKILLIDDHPIVREGLRQIIADAGNMEITGDAGNGKNALELFQKNNYDIVILDLSLPDINGMEILDELKIIKPDVPVLILSTFPEDKFAFRMIKAGAKGYVNKMSAPEQLVDAINVIYSGEYYISKQLAERLAISLTENIDKIFVEKFSLKEFNLMCLIISGLSDEQISDKLSIDISEMQNLRLAIYEKLNLTKDSELMKYFIEEGFY